MPRPLESFEKKLISILSGDGRLSIGKISQHLGVTNPTVRSRIRNLVDSGILKIAGLVNPFKTKGLTLALVGINLLEHQRLDEKLNQIASLEKVSWAAVVTGRYDIFAEVVLDQDMDTLYDFITVELPRLGGIRSSESFMVMKAKGKWVLLPQGITSWGENRTNNRG